MLVILGTIAAALLTLFFSTLTYALRDYSLARLEDRLEAVGKRNWLEATVDHREDLVFVTAVGRLFGNIFVFMGVMHSLHGYGPWVQYPTALGITGIVSLFFSVAIPHALATHASESIIAVFVRPMHAVRVLLVPFTKILHAVDALVARVAGRGDEPAAEEIEQDILSVVQEGAKEGVVDEQEREMIESVIEFGDTQAGQIMTARPQIVALESHATLEEIKQTIEESGLSRIPIFEDTLDHVVGVLYARDLLKHLGAPPDRFDIRPAMRPAVFVPESKPLRDLLREFRIQKVHIAIVLDEYGGTAGLVTIEDILEELVGEISDEHEPAEPAMLKKLDDRTWEADARLTVYEANRNLGIALPTDAGYDTLGGFVSMTLGRIPSKGTTFTHEGARFTILAAEPQRVSRLKVELLPQPAPASESA